MPALLDELNRFLDEDKLRLVSRHLGIDQGPAGRAIRVALPVLLAGLRRWAARDGEALEGRLARHHDGSLLDNLDEVLGRSSASGATLADAASGGPGGLSIDRDAVDGAGLLDRLFGERRSAVELAVGKAGGLQAGEAGSLMATLAPLVMSALGRVMRRDDLGAEGLSDLLEREVGELATALPGGAAGLVGGLLDTDAEGDVIDRVGRLGGDLLEGGGLSGLLKGGR